jgi:predicted kinase
VTASPEVLRERVARRVRKGGDASEADMRVLEHQLQTEEPLDADEAAAALVYDSTQAFDADDNAAAIGELLARLEKPLQGLR